MKLKHAIVLLAAYSNCLISVHANGVTDASNSTWKLLTSSDGSLPVKRHEAAYVQVGSKFLLVGGRRLNPVSVFDPQTRKWAQGAVPPIELHHFQPAIHGNKCLIRSQCNGHRFRPCCKVGTAPVPYTSTTQSTLRPVVETVVAIPS